MLKRHITYYLKDIKPVNCGEIKFLQIKTKGYYQLPFETQPTIGEHDYTNCKNCKELRKGLVKKLYKFFNGTKNVNKFPFCCEYHKNLLKLKEFNRASFEKVPEMVADKIIFTRQHIINNHAKDNYYKDITDYIQYTVESFGQFPNECGIPLYADKFIFHLRYFLKKNEEIKEIRKDKILEFLNLYISPTEDDSTDFNILISTYNRWLKIFPFELSFFNHLKSQFENTLPLGNGISEYNPYSKETTYKMHTKASLIDTLLNLTNSLLTQINTSTLFEKSLLTEPKKIELELIVNERKQKLKQGYVNNSKSEETKYRKILKEWFKDEKKFMKEIVPLLKNVPPQKSTKKKDKEFENHFFNIKEKETFLKELKTIFNTEKGINFGILIDELKKNDILKIGNQEFENFINKAKAFFNRDIATRVAIRKYKPEEQVDLYKKEIDIIQNKLKPLIKKYKSS